MKREQTPAGSRVVPATGADPAKHPRLNEGYDRPARAVNVSTPTRSCAPEWDALVLRALARLNAALWTLRSVGATDHERRLRAGALAASAFALDASWVAQPLSAGLGSAG